MDKKRKMNLPYKLALAMLILCFLIFCAAILIAYGFENTTGSIICSGVGVFFAFVGIILASVSKEKKEVTADESADNFQEKD